MFGLILLFIIIGLFAGATGSIVGIGGGMFFVPALLFFVNQQAPGTMTPQMAAATSLAVIAVTGLSSSLSYLKQKRVDTQAALLFFLGSAPGAVAGVYLNKLLHFESFSLFFGLFQLGMFVLLMVRDRIKPRTLRWDVKRTFIDAEGIEYEYGYQRWLAVTIAFFVGIVSSLFGVGGGILMVPSMIILFRFPPHVATATSMLVIFLSAVVGSVTNALHGHIDWLYAACLAPGAWFGGKAGAQIAARLKGKTVVLVLRVLILGIAIQMIGEAILE
nr:sulfite exporter TauE/SafE family protein [Brevibacillus sp. SYP-B805]